MTEGYAKCKIASYSLYDTYDEYVGVNIKGSELLEFINDDNIKNWTKITGTRQMPKIVQLTWSEMDGDYYDAIKSAKKSKNKIIPDFIPKEFIIFYRCDYLSKKNNGNYSRRDLLCKKYGLYGFSDGNSSDQNNLSCETPCQGNKKCLGYNCCNVYSKYTDTKQLVYCKNCANAKKVRIAFNLFEIMRQILVAKCAIGEKKLIPYLLNPVTQSPFTIEELNNFTELFKSAITKWKQNNNINKSFLRKNMRKISSKPVTAGFIIATSLVVPGGQAAVIIAILQSIQWGIMSIEHIKNVWEFEKISGNFKHNDKEYITASAKVVLASVEGLIFTLVNTTQARQAYSRFKALGNKNISGPLLKNQLINISPQLLKYVKKAALFDYGLPLVKDWNLTGENLHILVKQLTYSGYAKLMYNMEKLKKIKKGKIKPDSFDKFDHKLNLLIIQEQDLRAAQLPLNRAFINNSSKNPFIQNFCETQHDIVNAFKLVSRRNKINRTLVKSDNELSTFQRIGKKMILNRSERAAAAAGGGSNIYNTIINPKTGTKVHISSKMGKQILQQYVKFVTN